MEGGGEQVIWEGRPSWRSMLAYYIKWGLVALVPAIAVALLNWLADTDLPFGIAVLVSVILLVLVLAIGWLKRIATYYLVTDHRILIRRGVLSRHESSAALDRVQNVNTSQSFLERLLNTGDVDFDTAGYDPNDKDFVFIGIDDPHGLRDRLDAVARSRSREQRGPV